jgi:hypothetical protein
LSWHATWVTRKLYQKILEAAMNWKHWAGVAVVLAIGYYMGKKGYLDTVLAPVLGAVGA